MALFCIVPTQMIKLIYQLQNIHCEFNVFQPIQKWMLISVNFRWDFFREFLEKNRPKFRPPFGPNSQLLPKICFWSSPKDQQTTGPNDQ